MHGKFVITINGRPVQVEGAAPTTTLLDFLRSHGYTGGKVGCAEGDCGACTVALLGRAADGKPTYRAVNSCIALLPMFAGREIVTVEGLAAGAKLHPVQAHMVKQYGSQCGYCTPGFVMSLFEGYYREDCRDARKLSDQLSGNLCRCTGYRPIRDAALGALAQRELDAGGDAFRDRLGAPLPALEALEYSALGESFFRPTSLEALFALMADHPAARLVAGATEIGVEINKKFSSFPELISLEGIPELVRVGKKADEWLIGGAATLTTIEEAMAGEYPSLARMLGVFASRGIRNRATMGGNLVTASPIGDSAPVLLTLDAYVVLASAEGERRLPISEFLLGYRKTALRAGEIILGIAVPLLRREDGLTRRMDFLKVSKRRELDISIVAGAFRLEVDDGGVVRLARLAYGGVALKSSRALKAEEALVGRRIEESEAAVAEALRGEFQPIDDVRGSAVYRRALIVSLWEKFVRGERSVAHDGDLDFSLGQVFPEVDASRALAHESARSLEHESARSLKHESARSLEHESARSLEHESSRSLEHESARSLEHESARSLEHESAKGHVTGGALYVDDAAKRRPMLEAWPVCSPYARARITSRNADKARAAPGVAAVLLAEDVLGENNVGTARRDEPLFAVDEVLYHGQVVALVVGDSIKECRRAASLVEVVYEPLEPTLGVVEAVEKGSYLTEPHELRRGDCEAALAAAPLRLEGEFESGGQEHFYLETQAAWAEAGENGVLSVCSSTQHPSEIQTIVAEVLGLPRNMVVVQSPRMGGGFGGKEVQGNAFAAMVSLAAVATGKPVRMQLDRDLDMTITGKRHPFHSWFTIGYDGDGRLLAARVRLVSDGGWSLDLSQPILDRALFHLDNVYYIPAVEFSGRVARTNTTSHTAFRGFGGPQAMLVMEEIVDRVARRLGLSPERVRAANLYHGAGETNTTHYGLEIGDNRLGAMWEQVQAQADFAARRRAVDAWNAEHAGVKRGLAVTAEKFGISFTRAAYNQGGALVVIYQDGSVQVNHGGTEMGQGLHTKVLGVAMRELGLPAESFRIMPTATDKVPNTSATAASSGADLNGQAVKKACATLRERLAPVAADLLGAKLGRTVDTGEVVFSDGFARAAVSDSSEARERNASPVKVAGAVPFASICEEAYLRRVSMSALGYYATPGLDWDWDSGRGRPFYYFACGAAVSEVEVDGYTGMHRVLRVDIVHDVGDSLNPGVDRGQIEGGFVQGMGWLTREELRWDKEGRLMTHGASTYQIPAISDAPLEFRVTLLPRAAQEGTIHGSKAVGEPPLMLSLSVREAIRDAIAAFGPRGGEVRLPSPATGEAIFAAVQERLGR